MYKIKERIYHWMLIKLPIFLMYNKVKIDNKSIVYVPRFGYSKQMKDDADKKVERLMKIFEG